MTRIRASFGSQVRPQSKTKTKTWSAARKTRECKLCFGFNVGPQRGASSFLSRGHRAWPLTSGENLRGPPLLPSSDIDLLLDSLLKIDWRNKINSRLQSPSNKNQTSMAATLLWVSLTARGPQACHSTSLSLSLFICKMGTMTVSTPQGCCEDPMSWCMQSTELLPKELVLQLFS